MCADVNIVCSPPGSTFTVLRHCMARRMSLLGDQRWAKDEVPFFTLQGHAVPTGLAKVVRPVLCRV